MRTTGDRIRHALSFEIIGLLLVVPLAATGFGVHLHDVGVVAIAAATLATLWNYIYNLGFDRLMIRWMGTVHKTLPVRVLHAVLFETGLLMVTLPFIAWYLGMGLWQALLMDIAFAVFYLVYAFVFNWSYDQVFPLPKEASYRAFARPAGDGRIEARVSDAAGVHRRPQSAVSGVCKVRASY